MINSFDNFYAISPRTNLRNINQKAQELIDNRLNKQKVRERDYSPSNIPLTDNEFNAKLNDDWNRDLTKLNEVLDQGNNVVNSDENVQMLNEDISYGQDELNNFNNLRNESNQLKNNGIDPLNYFDEWKNLAQQLDVLSKRVKDSYKSKRDYSPSNKYLDNAHFEEKRRTDFAKAKLDAIKSYEDLKKLNVKAGVWGDHRGEALVVNQHLKDNVMPILSKYNKKEIEKPQIQQSVEPVQNPIQYSEKDRENLLAYLKNKYGTLDYKQLPNRFKLDRGFSESELSGAQDYRWKEVYDRYKKELEPLKSNSSQSVNVQPQVQPQSNTIISSAQRDYDNAVLRLKIAEESGIDTTNYHIMLKHFEDILKGRK